MKNNRALIIAAVIIIAAILIYTFYHQGEKHQDRVMTDFVSQSISAITGTWDPKELQDRADPAFTNAVKASGKSMDDFFNMLRTLGKAKGNIACSRLRYSVITEAAGKYATADFACKADFEHGQAIIVIQIRQTEMRGPWRITMFRVDSPLFAPKDKKGADDHNQ